MENPVGEVETELSGQRTAVGTSAIAGRRRVTVALLIAMMVDGGRATRCFAGDAHDHRGLEGL